MHIELKKASGKSICRNGKCKKLPQYISAKGRILKDTTCVVISISGASGWAEAYYCRDCVDQLYLELKTKLNPNLWVFH